MRVLGVAVMAALLAAGPVVGAESKDPAGDEAMRLRSRDAESESFEAANQALDATNSDPSLMAESEKMDNEPDKTFADVKAKIARHPRFYAFFAKQGISQDDVVLISRPVRSPKFPDCGEDGRPRIAVSNRVLQRQHGRAQRDEILQRRFVRLGHSVSRVRHEL
jgi:hypothetical protein